MKKIDFIHCRINPEAKRKLKDKAKELKCKNFSEFFERIATETIVFLDPNVKNLLMHMAKGLCHI